MNSTPEEFLPCQSPEFLKAEIIQAQKCTNLVALITATAIFVIGFALGALAANL